MRVKQTAKKISDENLNQEKNNDNSNDVDNSEHNSCDNANEISDNEVEFLVECRRDQEGNQFLLDGTLVIEPAAVDTTSESKENQTATKEINFDQFIKEMQFTMPENDHSVKCITVTPKRNAPSFGPNPNIATSIKCSACNLKINCFTGQVMHKHPLMEVVLCSNCIKNQKDEFFVIDKEDNKETLCRWCVEGGSLICCDFCPKSFCKTCIKRNLGRIKLSEILDQDDSVEWKCFVCDPEPIEPLKLACRKMFFDVKAFFGKPKFDKKPISRLSEVVNKKRSILKAFPRESNCSPAMKAAKVTTLQTSAKANSNSGSLLNSMANFGTDWYMRNVKLHDILTEIDEIDPRTLLNAINSAKKCVEAFYSDIRNLETEISKASTAADIPAVVCMFKSVYRHHLFNRFCQLRSRVEEDRRTKFVAQTITGSDFGLGGARHVVNTNSVPSLIINNVVSTAPFISKYPPQASVVVKSAAHFSNGHAEVHESIDLTDELDRPGPHSARSTEVVDLCADEDVGSLCKASC